MSYFPQDFGYGDFGDAVSAAKAPIAATSLNLNDSDTALGWQIVNQFYTYASMYPNFKLTSPIDILNYYMVSTPGPFDPNAFLQSIGMSASLTGLGSSDTDTAMQAMASAGAGQIPTNWSAWGNYLQNQASGISGWSEAYYVITQSVADIGTGLQQTGDVLISAGNKVLQTASIWSNLIYILPAVGIYYYYKTHLEKKLQ